jgi:hypothetical protein
MSTWKCRRRAASCVLAGVLAAAATRAAGEDADPSAGVLVLRNGNVLAGAVSRNDDGYFVQMADARLRIPAAQVQCHCQSLNEAYELRRRDRTSTSADAHLELARWCLRNDLLDQAAREALDARTIDAGHPGVRTLDFELSRALKRRAEASARPRPDETGEAEVSAAPPPPARLPAGRPVALDVSAEAQATFVRNIQPMLVHSCALGGCHQPGSDRSLQLDRWAIEGSGNATLVRRNLAAVLAQIDRQHPASSPLVQWARQPHGNAAGKASQALTPHQTALLLEWLNAVAGVKPDAAAAESQAAPPADAAADDEMTDASAAASSNVVPAVLKRSRRSAAPRDPFDPEIFNRRYGARAKAAHRGGGEPASAPAETADEAGSTTSIPAATEPAAE